MTENERTHDVHACAVVRVKVLGVPGTTHADSIRRVESAIDAGHDLDRLLTRNDSGMRLGPYEVDHTEYAEEIAYYLVDEPEELDRSRWYPGVFDPEAGADVVAALRRRVERLEETLGAIGSGKVRADLVAVTAELERVGVGCGPLGNGVAFWDREREQDRDYLRIAHLSPDGELRVYEAATPAQRAAIASYAAKQAVERPAEKCQPPADGRRLERLVPEAVRGAQGRGAGSRER